MKSLSVLLLLIIVVSVVRGASKCYFCYGNCDKDDILEGECEKDSYCFSLTTSDPDSDIMDVKECADKKNSEDYYCKKPREKGDKCYVCDEDFCNENEDK